MEKETGRAYIAQKGTGISRESLLKKKKSQKVLYFSCLYKEFMIIWNENLAPLTWKKDREHLNATIHMRVYFHDKEI